MEAGIPARLTPAQGRRFGLTVGVAFLVLAVLLHAWRQKEIAAAVVGIIGAGLILAAFSIPGRLGPVQRCWMGIAHVISKVTTPVFMGIVFFLVVTPVGILMRLFGRQTLTRPERDGSYWANSASGGRSNMERQF